MSDCAEQKPSSPRAKRSPLIFIPVKYEKCEVCGVLTDRGGQRTDKNYWYQSSKCNSRLNRSSRLSENVIICRANLSCLGLDTSINNVLQSGVYVLMMQLFFFCFFFRSLDTSISTQRLLSTLKMHIMNFDKSIGWRESSVNILFDIYFINLQSLSCI